MKKIYLTLVGMLFVVFVMAQKHQQLSITSETNNGNKKCATAEWLKKYISQNPNAVTDAQFETWLSQKIAERRAAGITGRTVTPNVVLPVVFHIIHDNEAVGVGRNIPQAVVYQQVMQLNKDFANLSHSPYGVSENTGIQFALAQTDPLGATLSEPGIDRINRNDKAWTAPPYTVGYASSSDYLTNNIKPNSIWDPTRYLNIWVSEWESGILGIATFPASSGLSGLDNSETNSTAGVTIGYNTLGSVYAPFGTCTDQYNRGRTLTHELGHFFGLRHIWGDGTCATDYCNDTPTHEQDNSGVPVHPKPNSCGTTDEMFENYMDYCDDIALNTFTTNQVDRIEAVMANSPRRGTLATSTVGKVPVPGSNNIAFLSLNCTTTATVSETSSMTVCPKYKDIDLYIIVENKATATTTVTINTSGTASNGSQYQVLTPSVTFDAGDVTKKITIRIFDDGVALGNSTIILSYSIGSGGGVTAGGSNQSYTINLADNDVNGTINNINTGTVLYTENFGTTTGSNQLPTGWTVSNALATTNSWAVNNAGAATYGFTGNALHITNGNSTAINNGTAPIMYSATAAGTDSRAFTPTINANGYSKLNLSFKLVCNGEEDAGEFYDYGIVYYSTNGTNFSAITDINGNYIIQGISTNTTLSLNLPESVVGTSTMRFLFRWLSDGSVQNQPPFVVDDIVLTSLNTGVETVLSQSVTQSQGSGQLSQYISNTGKIIAAINNPSANIGCVTATVTGAGNGQTAVTTTAGSYVRSNKVIQLTPANANSTATYQATFYFTTDELAAWGANVPNLKILKVADGVSLSSTLTAANSAVFTPTVNDQRVAAGYASFTINATGGFSQFMLASPNTTVPIQLLSFDARGNGKSILLTWSTATEQNNRGFAIERSTDGTHFENIGWVDGAINSTRQSNYSYPDYYVQPNQVYYYRLRQTDMDARTALSEVRQASIKGNGSIFITVSPNPASEKITIFAAGTQGNSDVFLYDSKGRLVQSRKAINCSIAPYHMQLGNLTAGIYLLKVQNGLTSQTQKLIVQ